MKFSMLTIAGALASANAASFRGDAAAALKKMAVMQKLTDAANKKAFGTMRKLQDNENYNYGDQEITAETIIQPYVCTTATVYGVNGEGGEGGEQNQNAYNGYSAKPTISYLSFAAVSDADNNGYEYLYGQNDEYITTLSAYLQAIGTSYCEERANLCEDCENMENFCNMSDEEKQYFADMTEEEFQAYLEEVDEQDENNAYAAYAYEQANQNMQQDENNAYAYGGAGGRRNLFQSIQTLCGTCQQMCINNDDADEAAKYYEEMEKLFEESMCADAGGGVYIGHTCGSDGKSIELALFTDESCMYMAGQQNALYTLYQQAVYEYYQWSNKDLAYGYMEMVTEMFDSEFSCAMGAVRTYDGSEPSEACENLYENAISKTECQYGNNNQQQQQNQEGEGQQYYGNYVEGYDMYYSEDIENVCQSVLQLEANLLANGSNYYNPYNGVSFKQMIGEAGLSGGAIAGIVIAVLAVIGAVAAFAITKNKRKKTDLEEPVFQGGNLG